MKAKAFLSIMVAVATLAASCIGQARTAQADVDARRIVASQSDGANWLSHGRTYAEQRYSPLEKINDGNVGKLGLAWAMDLDNDRGLEATPLVVDGVMYSTLSWSRVFAVDAASGKQL